MPVAGGEAVVVTSAKRAGKGPRPPVHLLGAGEMVTHRALSQAPTLTSGPLKPAISQAFAQAGCARRRDATCCHSTTATRSWSPLPWRMPVFARPAGSAVARRARHRAIRRHAAQHTWRATRLRPARPGRRHDPYRRGGAATAGRGQWAPDTAAELALGHRKRRDDERSHGAGAGSERMRPPTDYETLAYPRPYQHDGHTTVLAGSGRRRPAAAAVRKLWPTCVLPKRPFARIAGRTNWAGSRPVAPGRSRPGRR